MLFGPLFPVFLLGVIKTATSEFALPKPHQLNIARGITLRTLPLGASIVYGLESTDENGFRYGLRNQLVYTGRNPVNMIGSVNHGTMADNQVEGWPDYRIDQVAQKAELSIPSLPNLVLIHVGTNDCVENDDIPNAGSRLGSLIDRLFDAIPGVTIVASTLLPNRNSATQANIEVFNRQIPDLVSTRQAEGKQITYVDFSSSYFSLSDIGPDGTHPTDAGYLKMAEVWYQGIGVAADQGWISAPAVVNGVSDTVKPSNNTCDKVPGAAIGPVQTQMGSGSDDGAYVHVGHEVLGFSGFVNPGSVNFNNSHPEGVFWADINGDGIDDYVYVGSNSKYGLGVALSIQGGGVGEYLYSFFSVSCNRPGVHLVDITGDGRDDFCCLGPDGGLECWENKAGHDPRSPSWIPLGTVRESEGYPQAQVRLADIDGDGRVDYVVFDASTSNIYGWRNGALQPGPPQYWYAMRGVISRLPAHDLAGWRFVDLNGDKKDDLVWVDANGAVTTWINRRGFSVGLGPQWVSHGVTHQGSTYPVNVTFGASMGSGRADYACKSLSSSAACCGKLVNAHASPAVREVLADLGTSEVVSVENGLVKITRWENLDHGGTTVRGDGTFYCDMTGSGSDDYIFINETGAITLFENDHNWGYWIPWGVIFNTHIAREKIYLADWNGDKKCDILIVDELSGSTTVFQNEFADGSFYFKDMGGVEGTNCVTGHGSDKHDRGVRFADLDGDGRADYLCMQTNGITTGSLNKGQNNLVNQGLIKHAEGKERANLRFADINGDGRADFLYVNPIDGAVTAWYNGGAIQSSGSAFQWNWAGNVSSGGSSRGECVEFGALYGVGRADYIVVEPATNKAWTWFNVCPDGGLKPASPDLPANAPPAPTPLGGLSSGFSIIKTTELSSGQLVTLTETDVPVTTTNAQGSTVVFTSTEGDGLVITTTNSNGVISTITSTVPMETLVTATLPSGAVILTTLSLPTQAVDTITLLDGSVITTTLLLPTQAVDTITLPDGSVVTTTISWPKQAVETITLPNGSVITTVLPSPTQAVETITLPNGSVITTTLPLPTQAVDTITLPDGSVITATVSLPTQEVTFITLSSAVVVTSSAPVFASLASEALPDGSMVTSNTQAPDIHLVTSTMTTVPPGVWIQDFTDFSISGNIWLTTTGSDHSTTIVPVLLPCVGCEPQIVWDLPEIEWVQFNWPSLPKIPKFHLPCIKVFGLKFGDCPKPSGPPPVVDGPPPEPESSKPPKSDTSSSTSSDTCTSSMTVTDCVVDCRVSDLGSTITTECYTTQCSSLVACSATPTTTTSTTTGYCDATINYDDDQGDDGTTTQGPLTGSDWKTYTIAIPASLTTTMSMATSTSMRTSSSTSVTSTSTRPLVSTTGFVVPSGLPCVSTSIKRVCTPVGRVCASFITTATATATAALYFVENDSVASISNPGLGVTLISGYTRYWAFYTSTNYLTCDSVLQNTVGGDFQRELVPTPLFPGETIFPSAIMGHTACTWSEADAPQPGTATLNCADTTVQCTPVASPTTQECFMYQGGVPGDPIFYAVADCAFF